MEYSLDSYLTALRGQTKQQLSFQEVTTMEDLLLRQVVARDKLRSLLKLADIPNKLPLLKTEEIEEQRLLHGCKVRRLALTICDGLSFPMYLLSPAEQAESRYTQCAVFCHGHGNGSRETLGLDARGNPLDADYHRLAPIELCKLGYTVAVPEILGFGDTCTTWDTTCRAAYGSLAMMGLSLAGLRVYQIMRVIDYLILYLHADIENLVCMGISGGGMLTTLTSACDTRISTAVVSGYLSSFAQSIMSIEHCICNFIPDLYSYFEMSDLAALILPRTLVMEAGTEDPIFPIEAARQTAEQLAGLYQIAGKPERFILDEFSGGHQISGRLAYPLLRKNLQLRLSRPSQQCPQL